MPPYQLDMPPMFRIRQRFDDTKLADVRQATLDALAAGRVMPGAGQTIAITAGSRGIANIATITKAAVDWVKGCGATPIIVPAMGSHGGATGPGQKEMVGEFGITEAAMGCEIRSDMEPVSLPQEGCEVPVYFDKNAYACDATIVLNRIKIHTCFHGKYESGLFKMMAIGLGKHKQALAIHSMGTHGLVNVMPQVARQVLKHANILMGLAIVENAYDETMHLRAMPAADIPEVELELIDMARTHMPKLPLEDFDLLVVDQMGKNISGVGMDSNILGRMGVPGMADPKPDITTVVVRDLTDVSHGNALGVGLADITTKRLFDKIDFKPLYENLYTSTFLDRGKIPVICDTDWEAIAFAVRCCRRGLAENLSILRIVDTLHLGEMHASPVAVEMLKDRDNIEVIGPVEPWFADRGDMSAF